MVVLESPYDSWADAHTELIFARMVGLKIRGYGREYPYGTLAVDTTDMISDHLLICEETSEGLRPLFGSKSVPLKKCLAHHLRFPGLSVPEDANAHQQAASVKRIIERALASHVDLRYIGSMTMDPSERGDKEWSLYMRDLFTAMYTSFHLELPTRFETLAGGTIRFKIDQYVKSLGHKSLVNERGEELGPISVTHLASEPVLWTHLTEFSWDARRVAQTYKHLWEARLHIKADRTVFEKLKRAA
jgi:hypothetical protein